MTVDFMSRNPDFMFTELCIETVGSCNRTCPTCLRNSYPDRPKVSTRFGKQTRMPDEMFYRIIDQAVDMGYTGMVNLQHFNEPLQDPRIVKFCKYAHDKGVFSVVRFHSNGDLLTERRAKELDGNVDHIRFAFYDDIGGRPMELAVQQERENVFRSWFQKTQLSFTGGGHMVTHYSPLGGLQEYINAARNKPCISDVRDRLIIDHRGEMLLCCDDIEGLWDLGNAENMTLEELWWSEKHVAIMDTLSYAGGREAYDYCFNCPRIS